MYIFTYFFICKILLSSYSNLVIKPYTYLLTVKNKQKTCLLFLKGRQPKCNFHFKGLKCAPPTPPPPPPTQIAQYKEPKHSLNNLLEHSQSHARVHAHTHTRMPHACTHTCTRVRTHTHTHTHTQSINLDDVRFQRCFVLSCLITLQYLHVYFTYLQQNP